VGAVSSRSDEGVLLERDAEFDRVTAAEGLEGFTSFIAEDAVFFPANAPLVTGREAIRTAWTEVLTTPGLSLRWQPIKAVLAQSGELGYTYGNYQLTTSEAEGQSVTRYGKYVTIWKKQSDGVWRVVVDVGNASPPPVER
jgi:ketosteroid isomerase-like protein